MHRHSIIAGGWEQGRGGWLVDGCMMDGCCEVFPSALVFSVVNLSTRLTSQIFASWQMKPVGVQ